MNEPTPIPEHPVGGLFSVRGSAGIATYRVVAKEGSCSGDCVFFGRECTKWLEVRGWCSGTNRTDGTDVVFVTENYSPLK